MKAKLVLLARLLLAGVFIYAGAIKIENPLRFAADISNYHFVPWAIGVRLAFYLPWLEIFAGIALFIISLRKGASLLLGALTIVFIAASVIAKARGIDISCGCFGHVARNLPFAGHLALDVLLLAFAAIVARADSSPSSGS
ncbi:MAG: DoxX family membrane protein [Verrucomicrobiota bacterium]|nr:DoxX family membrane protein [Verrucomicrobiota bacterium]